MKTSKSLLCENCGHLVPQIDEFGQENDHCPYCGYILISLEEKEKLMSDLKPCPFCGTSNEKHNNIVKLYDDEYYAYEYCNACGARVYANWNNRPIEDALRKEIAQLQADNRSLVEQMNQMAMRMEHKSGTTQRKNNVRSK